jgi:hypothetical protein
LLLFEARLPEDTADRAFLKVFNGMRHRDLSWFVGVNKLVMITLMAFNCQPASFNIRMSSLLSKV